MHFDLVELLCLLLLFSVKSQLWRTFHLTETMSMTTAEHEDKHIQQRVSDSAVLRSLDVCFEPLPALSSDSDEVINNELCLCSD